VVDPAPFVFSPELRAAVEAMMSAIDARNQEPRRQFIRITDLGPTAG
jgi:hypothetical protein